MEGVLEGFGCLSYAASYSSYTANARPRYGNGSALSSIRPRYGRGGRRLSTASRGERSIAACTLTRKQNGSRTRLEGRACTLKEEAARVGGRTYTSSKELAALRRRPCIEAGRLAGASKSTPIDNQLAWDQTATKLDVNRQTSLVPIRLPVWHHPFIRPRCPASSY